MNSPWQLAERDTGKLVAESLEIADGFASRMKGLLFRPHLDEGCGILLVPCPSVHSFFMRFSFDLLMLDKQGYVVSLYHGVKPWRLIFGKRNVHAVVELPENTAGVTEGMRLVLKVKDPANAKPPASVAFLCAP